MKHPITTVINYCTNDSKFLNHCITEASKFSQQVIIVYSSHFFDGTPENQDLIAQNLNDNPNATFIEFPFNPEKEAQFNANYWHNMFRWIAVNHTFPTSGYILFLDADEIVESTLFTPWLDTLLYKKYDAIKFENYWYFREPTFQATTTEESVIMVKKSSINPRNLFSQSERHALAKGKTLRHTLSLNQTPMIHHYSWVRTQEEMIKKVTTWGHKHDRDWTVLITEEFSHPFSGKDFVHGYSYKTVPSYIEIPAQRTQRVPNKRLSIQEIDELETLALNPPNRIKKFFESKR